MYCGSCHTPNPAYEKFCSKCGLALNGSGEQLQKQNDESIRVVPKVPSELEKKHNSGSGWFNTIAILSLINTIIVFAKWSIIFPVGLGTSLLAAAVFNYVPEDPNVNIGVVRMVGFFLLLISLAIIGLFFLFRVKAKKGKKWAYLAGMIIYFLDALICLWMKDWISAGFHGWGLLAIGNGFSALNKMMKDRFSETAPASENLSPALLADTQEPACSFSLFRDGDLPELEEMALSLYREDPCPEGMSLEKIEGTVREFTSRPEKGSVFLFRVGDAVAGYAMVVHFWSNEYGGEIAYLDELYVKPEWRGKGLGRSFVNHLPELRGGALKAIRLEVTPANDKAMEFYGRLGFEPMKNRTLFKKI